MYNEYSAGLALVMISAVIGFSVLLREKDDLHRLLIIDLIEIPSLAIIALLGTDLAEALILPGLVVGIAELLALSQIYITKEGLRDRPVRGLHIEVVERAHAPVIISALLVGYGIVLTGFTGGALAALGAIFFLISRDNSDKYEMVEMASGIAWAAWIGSFFVFMFFPQYWYAGVMGAAVGILLKVAAKMSLVGSMWGEAR